MRRHMLVAAACLVLGATAAGCGDEKDSAGAESSSGAKKVTIDVGGGKSVTVKAGKPRVAFFKAGTTDRYQVAFIAGVEEEAKRQGLDLTAFDPQYDPARQLEQVQNAMQRGGFDAYLIVALDGNTMCPILSKQAPAENVAVVTALTPICDRGLKPEGVEQWSPGTVAHVQNDSTVTEMTTWLDQVARRLSGKHTIAFLNGPPLITVAKAAKQAVQATAEKYPNLNFKYIIDTDFTTPTSYDKTQTILKAHPEIDVVASIYTDMTVGAIKAIKTAGRKDIKVFDQAGGRQSIEAVQAGDVVFTTCHTPRSNGAAALQAVVDATSGKKLERYIGVYPPGASLGNPLVVDKTNVEACAPQF